MKNEKNPPSNFREKVNAVRTALKGNTVKSVSHWSDGYIKIEFLNGSHIRMGNNGAWPLGR